MPENKHEKEVNILGDFFDIKKSTIIKLRENFLLQTEKDGVVQLRVDVTADLNTVDEKYHEVFFNMLSTKYSNKASFGDNPFSICKPIEKRKWYQFWKIKF